MFNVLIVEDDYNICKLMKIKLSQEGYNCYTAYNGIEGLERLAETHMDIVILDAMMPKMDGFEMVKEMRSLNYATPVIMVTARGEIEDKSRGFMVGVDDYMVKPIDFKELYLRMKAVLRRANIVSEKKIIIGSTVLDYNTLTVSCGEDRETLTKKEFQILFKLLSYPEQSFSKSALFEEFWDFDSDTEEDAVKVYINKIRNKISRFKEIDVETVRGVGYKGVKNEKN
ncbi:MAG: response regulator transcription factor [Clostridia bacterium]|nr:response regulator transcription factor [Clostridia bacterium]